MATPTKSTPKRKTTATAATTNTTSTTKSRARKTATATDTTITVSHEAIAQRAHELYVQSGNVDGRELDFWLEAERELREGVLN